MIVPEDKSAGIQFRLSSLSVKLIIGIVLLVFFSVVMMLIFYGRMLSSAVSVGELKRENQRLREYNSKVIKLETELKEYRIFLSKVATLAGVQENLLMRGREAIGGFANPVDSEALYVVGPQQLENVTTDAPMGLPLGGWLSRGFSDRHNGVDIAVGEGTEVKATADGIVKFIGWDETFDNLIILKHKQGYESYYGHNQKILVAPSQKVKRGEIISLSGNTGKSTAPHLHYEIKKEGKSINPLGFTEGRS